MTDKDKLLKLRKLADAMYYAAQYLTTDASRLHKAMDEYHKFIIHEWREEPVSNDLEEAANKYAIESYPDELSTGQFGTGEYEPYVDMSGQRECAVEDFKAGAKWQKEQFEKNRLEHCNSITEEQYNLEVGFIDQHLNKYNRMPTFLDAIEYGMDKMTNLMAEKATDAVVHIDAGGYPYIPQLELYDYDKDVPLAKEGDKYKVVLIKEE